MSGLGTPLFLYLADSAETGGKYNQRTRQVDSSHEGRSQEGRRQEDCCHEGHSHEGGSLEGRTLEGRDYVPYFLTFAMGGIFFSNRIKLTDLSIFVPADLR